MKADPKGANQLQKADKPIAAVTGGTGFLGRFIVSALTRAGWKVRLLVRSDPIHPVTPDLDAEIVLGDLFDHCALERLCIGADAVIHAAGLIKAKNRASFFSVNESGSANLALAASRISPQAQIIVVSSLAAREPELSDYAASKRAGEVAVRKNSKAPVTILRPSAIYGRWDKETLPLFKMASNGVIFTPNTPDARICLVNVSDVSNAVAALAGMRNAGSTYELTDANIEGYTWMEIAKEAGRAAGNTPRIVSIPPLILKASGLISESVCDLFWQTPMLTRGKVREMLHRDWSSSSQRQPPPEIWRPQVKLTEGFYDTVKWCQKEKWL